ncbi:Mut7-C ubiquitin/RNAse domain-containing protein [Pontibacter silvestris]|nr:Mut7-C ubiquitin/RNAse domain-containing protein [Pontibacter silvestris]MCC9137818.1 Mut7-C ubiquitin/RNAse domain-containing protein [Pontibacter silvestris]
MPGPANFRFYGSLNDFLPRSKKHSQISYDFKNTPAVKDAIEAIGIPHPEIDVVLANDVPVDFTYPLQPNDLIKVYPATPECKCPSSYSLQANLPVTNNFVLDVHLGKLAKALRMLGFNTLYQNDYTDKTIATIAEQENRIVLTRDVGLLKHKAIKHGYWLRSQHLEEQLAEVISYFKLKKKSQPFTRCLECNNNISVVAKEAVLDKLPPKTKQYFNEFYQCPTCSRVYWKGSHYDRMLQFVKRIEGSQER